VKPRGDLERLCDKGLGEFETSATTQDLQSPDASLALSTRECVKETLLTVDQGAERPRAAKQPCAAKQPSECAALPERVSAADGRSTAPVEPAGGGSALPTTKQVSKSVPLVLDGQSKSARFSAVVISTKNSWPAFGRRSMSGIKIGLAFPFGFGLKLRASRPLE